MWFHYARGCFLFILSLKIHNNRIQFFPGILSENFLNSLTHAVVCHKIWVHLPQLMRMLTESFDCQLLLYSLIELFYREFSGNHAFCLMATLNCLINKSNNLYDHKALTFGGKLVVNKGCHECCMFNVSQIMRLWLEIL